MLEQVYQINITQKVVEYTLITGTPGLSAYMDAVINNGFIGTKAEWLASLRGPALTWEDLTLEQKIEIKGDPLTWEDLTLEQRAALRGDNLKYEDLTPAEKLELKGDPLTWDDLTLEQKIALRGAAFTWEDMTENQKLELKGDPFMWQDFTEEMLAELKGAPGEQGPPNLTGNGAKITGIDAGEFGEESYADGYMYKCVQEGDETTAVWMKWAVLSTI